MYLVIGITHFHCLIFLDTPRNKKNKLLEERGNKERRHKERLAQKEQMFSWFKDHLNKGKVEENKCYEK